MSGVIVIIGGGHASVQLISDLRRLGFDGTIKLFSDEADLPYQRPPLSKAFLLGTMEEQRLFFRKPDFYQEQHIDLHLNEAVLALKPEQKQIETAKQSYAYDIAVLAMGGSPRRLPQAEGNVVYLHNKVESEALRTQLAQTKNLSIIGGGFIGLEVAASARKQGIAVELFEGAPRILSRVMAEQTSDFFTTYHQQQGVKFCFNTEKTGEGKRALANGLALVGIGMVPNVALAQEAGLAVEKGIVVNEKQQTEDSAIYAIGDCALAPHPLYSGLVRLESVQNANYHAAIAACAICKAPPPPPETPWFWSDQYDIKLQIAGLSQGYDRTIMRGDSTKKNFVLFYLAGDKVLAADCVNRPQEFLLLRKALENRQDININKLADESLSAKEIFSP